MENYLFSQSAKEVRANPIRYHFIETAKTQLTPRVKTADLQALTLKLYR